MDRPQPKQRESLLATTDLKIHFPVRRKRLFEPKQVVHAVDDLNLDVPKGSVLGIVGESGSGKTTAALGMIRLIPITSGKIFFRGQEITSSQGLMLKKLRRHMQVVFQDPYSSLNPRLRAGEIVREPLERMNIFDRKDRAERVKVLFDQVGLRREQMLLFPHQFSGGQRQRKEELALTYVFISHDLGVVQFLCEYITVMYLGIVMETAPRSSLFKSPQNPYTKALLKAIPTLKGDLSSVPIVNAGAEQPTAINPGPGCRFAPRCPHAKPVCRKVMPVLKEIAPGHRTACHLFE
jgi:oligopeptide/dipeptide ABC transporter ATP-binding protein